jgi:hypothetical protein
MIAIQNTGSYKIGLNEVIGLKDAMREAMKPIQDLIKEKTYWIDEVEISESEYKSRDGFIPHSNNCGGLEIFQIIPKYELDNFDCIPVTECTEYDNDGNETDLGNHECDENCDHSLRIWFKFEGIELQGEGKSVLKFWLYMGGGNDDAPHFRTKHEKTIFEYDFDAIDVKQFKFRAKEAVKKLTEVLK